MEMSTVGSVRDSRRAADTLSMMYKRIAATGALVPLVFALLGVAAWTTGRLRLASLHAAYIPMAPSTAIGFLPVSVVLIATAFGRGRTTPLAVRAAAGLVFALASIKLVELFAPLLYGGAVIPMALTTGIAFIGTGVALVSLAGPAALPRVLLFFQSALFFIGPQEAHIFDPATSVLADVLSDLVDFFRVGANDVQQFHQPIEAGAGDFVVLVVVIELKRHRTILPRDDAA